MRFTKHLTAVACAVAFLAGGATAETCDETGERYDTVASEGETKGIAPLIRAIMNVAGLAVLADPTRWSEEGREAALNNNPNCVKNTPSVPYATRQKYAAADGFFADETQNTRVLDILLAAEPELGGRIRMVGVTQYGSEVTLHCKKDAPCTFGSLNKHALAWGLPFMVPKELFDTLQLEQTEDTWSAVAALLWSPKYGELDENAASARAKFLNNPTGYVDAQRSLASAFRDVIQQPQITVESSGELPGVETKITIGTEGSEIITISGAITSSGTQNETETLPACTGPSTDGSCTHDPNHDG